MTADVPHGSVPRGRVAFAVLGYGLRGIKTLPRSFRESVMAMLMGGTQASLPPFPDVLRLIESAGGIPNGKRWQERLVRRNPRLGEVRVRDVEVAGGRVHARMYLPPVGAQRKEAAFVWIHGGAFVLGGLDQEESHWPAMCLAADGIPVMTVDYRMCLGGVHHPAPQDDVLDGWRWAVEHADELGVEPEHLHLGGASAGGCLAAGAALRLRDEHEVQPASLFLAYPVLQRDLPIATPEAAEVLARHTALSDQWVCDMFDNWAGSADQSSPYVSPGLTPDDGLAGLPPTYVLSCGKDILRRGSEAFAVRLGAVGTPVFGEVFDESTHAPLDRPGTPDGERAISRLHTWLTGGVAAMDL